MLARQPLHEHPGHGDCDQRADDEGNGNRDDLALQQCDMNEDARAYGDEQQRHVAEQGIGHLGEAVRNCSMEHEADKQQRHPYDRSGNGQREKHDKRFSGQLAKKNDTQME